MAQTELLKALRGAPPDGLRALDAKLLMLLHPQAKMEPHCESYWVPECDEKAVGGFEVPYFTELTEHAESLIPEGWVLRSMARLEIDDQCFVEVVSRQDDPKRVSVIGQHQTRAIAVCIAAVAAIDLSKA